MAGREHGLPSACIQALRPGHQQAAVHEVGQALHGVPGKLRPLALGVVEHVQQHVAPQIRPGRVRIDHAAGVVRHPKIDHLALPGNDLALRYVVVLELFIGGIQTRRRDRKHPQARVEQTPFTVLACGTQTGVAGKVGRHHTLLFMPVHRPQWVVALGRRIAAGFDTRGRIHIAAVEHQTLHEVVQAQLRIHTSTTGAAKLVGLAHVQPIKVMVPAAMRADAVACGSEILQVILRCLVACQVPAQTIPRHNGIGSGRHLDREQGLRVTEHLELDQRRRRCLRRFGIQMPVKGHAAHTVGHGRQVR